MASRSRLNLDGSVTFSGVQEGDQYGVGTGQVNGFDALVVQDVSGGFDLGVFSIGVVDNGQPIDLSLGVTATDADGDTSTGTIDVTLVPDAVNSAAVVNTLAATNSLSSAVHGHLEPGVDQRQPSRPRGASGG